MRDRMLPWCLKQKRGIRLVAPNENLTRAYLKKAISALNTMNAALEIKEAEWTAATAYYARYFALYALFMKMGIKSEIHDCSVALARFLSEKGVLKERLVVDISDSKQVRIDTQYYVQRELDQTSIKRNAENARKFVLEIERVIESISAETIEDIRAHIRKLENR